MNGVLKNKTRTSSGIKRYNIYNPDVSLVKASSVGEKFTTVLLNGLGLGFSINLVYCTIIQIKSRSTESKAQNI